MYITCAYIYIYTFVTYTHMYTYIHICITHVFARKFRMITFVNVGG